MSNLAFDQQSYNYCALPLAAWACRPDQSRGRLHKEPESQYRTCFQRDRDRIIHSAAFRRLQYKTQVFVYHEGDHYRTRLTHTLEVAQIARTLARALMVNEDLAETVALAHDLGHTPFAHVGEDTLAECMKDVGGYDHNDQSLRVLTLLETRYPEWTGLNLTWETLEGVVKHNGPVTGKHRKKGNGKDLTVTLSWLQKQTDLRLDTHASVEAQIAALADDIAYNNHDVDDGLSAGLFSYKDIEAVPLLAEIKATIRRKYPGLADDKMLAGIVVREVMGAMVRDVLEETNRRLKEINPGGCEDIRSAGKQTVSFSPAMHDKVEQLRAFLYERMYRHYQVNRMRLKVSRIVRDLYEAFIEDYRILPDHWQVRFLEAGGEKDKRIHARIVADYIAGMTDRFAIREHERLFEIHNNLR